jgi:hypothetical protein
MKLGAIPAVAWLLAGSPKSGRPQPRGQTKCVLQRPIWTNNLPLLLWFTKAKVWGIVPRAALHWGGKIAVPRTIPSGHQAAPRCIYAFHPYGALWVVTVISPIPPHPISLLNISYGVWLQNTGIYMPYQVNLQNPEDDKQDPYHKVQSSHSNATDNSCLQGCDTVSLAE